MEKYYLNPIGKISVSEEGFSIIVNQDYIPGLQGLEGFGHLNILYWCHLLDTPEARNILEAKKPYANSPDIMGIFATRSPARPNPIALSAVKVLNIDFKEGIIHIEYTDAEDGTPLIDIKPYTGSSDRIENLVVPEWCAHWPKSYEESGAFDWEKEFNF